MNKLRLVVDNQPVNCLSDEKILELIKFRPSCRKNKAGEMKWFFRYYIGRTPVDCATDYKALETAKKAAIRLAQKRAI
jgi:hypothetical protein